VRFEDIAEEEAKRFYKLETLASATEGLLQGRDLFITPSVHAVLGQGPIASFHFRLARERLKQYVFRLDVVNRRRKRASFVFAVAQHWEAISKAVEAEHRTLSALYSAAPDYVVQPYQGGRIQLPERRRRTAHRKVYAYLSEWAEGFEPLELGRDGQLMTAPVQLLSERHTEDVRKGVVALVAQTYDPVRRTCMQLPDPVEGDLLVRKPSRGPLHIKLVGCRGLLRGVSPAKLIHTVATARWGGRNHSTQASPRNPSAFFDALARAVGKGKARDWLVQYRVAVTQGKLPALGGLSLEGLANMGIGEN
jgi:hypothetical protein